MAVIAVCEEGEVVDRLEFDTDTAYEQCALMQCHGVDCWVEE